MFNPQILTDVQPQDIQASMAQSRRMCQAGVRPKPVFAGGLARGPGRTKRAARKRGAPLCWFGWRSGAAPCVSLWLRWTSQSICSSTTAAWHCDDPNGEMGLDPLGQRYIYIYIIYNIYIYILYIYYIYIYIYIYMSYRMVPPSYKLVYNPINYRYIYIYIYIYHKS